MVDLDNSQLYDSIFTGVFQISKDDLGGSFTFALVDAWDSLAHMALIGELEDAFDVLLETEEILNFGSYENGKRILKKHGILFE